MCTRYHGGYLGPVKEYTETPNRSVGSWVVRISITGTLLQCLGFLGRPPGITTQQLHNLNHRGRSTKSARILSLILTADAALVVFRRTPGTAPMIDQHVEGISWSD